MKHELRMTEEAQTCDLHGDYVASTTTSSRLPAVKWTTRCPACENDKLAKQEREEAKQKEKARLDRISGCRRAAGLPARFECCTFENYIVSDSDQQHALSVAKGFADNFQAVREAGNSLAFCGTPGCGKTHLVCAIANQLLESRYRVIYTQTIELVRAIRDTWRHNSGGERNHSHREVSNRRPLDS
jgi:DNA replication protein DnaC